MQAVYILAHHIRRRAFFQQAQNCLQVRFHACRYSCQTAINFQSQAGSCGVRQSLQSIPCVSGWAAQTGTSFLARAEARHTSAWSILHLGPCMIIQNPCRLCACCGGTCSRLRQPELAHLKSGIPTDVEMPAPVMISTLLALEICTAFLFLDQQHSVGSWHSTIVPVAQLLLREDVRSHQCCQLLALLFNVTGGVKMLPLPNLTDILAIAKLFSVSQGHIVRSRAGRLCYRR